MGHIGPAGQTDRSRWADRSVPPGTETSLGFLPRQVKFRVASVTPVQRLDRATSGVGLPKWRPAQRPTENLRDL